jgi:PAS domain S-box-containing protein
VSIRPASIPGKRLFVLLLLAGSLLLPAQAGFSQTTGEPIHVLFLSFGSRDWPTFATLVEEFRTELEQRENAPVYIYVETFDAYAGSNGQDFEETMEELLPRKYGNRSFDLVVAIGGRPMDFVLSRRAKLFPRAKILYTTVFHQPVPDATGVLIEANLFPTAEMALRQNPGTRRLLLITGSSATDQTGITSLREDLQRQLTKAGRAVTVETLAPMTYSDARRQISKLPRDTVGIFVYYFGDSAGQVVNPTRVLAEFSGVCPRPIYSVWEADVGRGSVGGRVISTTQSTEVMAGLAARVLRGEDPGKIPPVRGAFQRDVFDWLQMKRWGIKLDQLPPGSAVINREYTVWELYRWPILGGGAMILLEAALVFLLLRLRSIRQRREEELRRLIQRGRGALRAARMGHWEFDVATAQFAFNDQYYSLHGMTAEEAGGYLMSAETFASRYVHPDDAHLVGEAIQQAIETKDPAFQFQEEPRILRADGEPRTVAVWFRIEKDPQGRTAKLVGVSQDISERKRVEEALLSSEVKYRTVVEMTGTGYLIIDSQGRVLDANQQYVRLSGHGALREILGRSVLEWTAKGAKQQNAEAVAQCAKDGLIRNFVTEYVDGKGQATFVEVNATVEGKGESLRIVSLCRDVTARKRAQQAIQELSGRLIVAQEEERSRIARELHDDINQQMALLAIELQLLDMSAPAGPFHSQLEHLWKKINEISGDIQSLSRRLHSSRLKHLGLVSALRELCQDFRKQQQIAVEFQAGGVPAALSNQTSLNLFRIAQECLRNVGKHSGARTVRMNLAGSGGHLVLRISDDGVGFVPGPSAQRGLGMVSMQERLRLVGGELLVRSAESGGTVVEARVPISPPADARASSPSGSHEVGDEEPAGEDGVDRVYQVRSHS